MLNKLVCHSPPTRMPRSEINGRDDPLPTRSTPLLFDPRTIHNSSFLMFILIDLASLATHKFTHQHVRSGSWDETCANALWDAGKSTRTQTKLRRILELEYITIR